MKSSLGPGLRKLFIINVYQFPCFFAVEAWHTRPYTAPDSCQTRSGVHQRKPSIMTVTMSPFLERMDFRPNLELDAVIMIDESVEPIIDLRVLRINRRRPFLAVSQRFFGFVGRNNYRLSPFPVKKFESILRRSSLHHSCSESWSWNCNRLMDHIIETESLYGA